MTDTSARLGLPLIAAGQAQKETFHNEALILIDALVQARVESMALATPPSSPAIGRCWIVAAGASGGWTGQAGAIAAWSDGGWRFVSPIDGMAVWSADDDVWLYRRAGTWVKGELPVTKVVVAGQQVVGERGGAIAAPSGGTTVDTEARSTIAAILDALIAHGLIAA